MKHTISVLVENRFGVLARISGLFSARGFNINSLAVGETEDPTVSRMTIIVGGDERTLEQVKKQLNKLIDVIAVSDFTRKDFINRELILIKVNASLKNRSQIIEIIDTLEAKVVNVGTKTLTLELCGDGKKINAVLELLRPFGIKEVVRTGTIAIGVGKNKEEESG